MARKRTRATATTVPVSTREQKGLHFHGTGGKTVSGDLVEDVMARAQQIGEENRAQVAHNDREELARGERLQQSADARAARPLHDRQMDTKHEVAAALRQSGVPAREAEERARAAVERSARE